MNPFQIMGPVHGAMDMVGQIRAVMQNPASIADVLLQKKSIDQNTYDRIKGMNPQQVGQFMMQNGIINPQQAQSIYQNQVPQIQRML